MYMEMDGDEIAITYIKDVTFNTNLPDVEILKMTKPPFVMEKWIVGIEEHQSVECVVTYESDVRAPKSTRHIQAICWSKVKAQDEVETVQLMIQTSLPNSEGNSRSRSDSSIDSQWMQTLRMHQIAKAISLQHSHPHSPTTVTHYLPYLRSQDSYAAAVRRTRGPVSYQFTSISHSRNSSPLSHSLVRNLSNLHLNSKGSSTSSTASDTPSERDRSAGKGRNASHSGNSRSSSDGRCSGTSSPVPPRHSGRSCRTSSPVAPPASQHRRAFANSQKDDCRRGDSPLNSPRGPEIINNPRLFLTLTPCDMSRPSIHPRAAELQWLFFMARAGISPSLCQGNMVSNRIRHDHLQFNMQDASQPSLYQ
ncbi:mitogen-activated protein kinase kinase kinase 20-like [Morphnus guianensis]